MILHPSSFILLFLLSCDGRPDPGRPPSLRDAEEPPPGTAFVEPVPEEQVAVRRAVYVPLYPHVYLSDSLRPYRLSASLCVRNTDRRHPIVLTAIRYHDRAGREVRAELDRPLRLAPLVSVDTYVTEGEPAADLSASLIVEWVARQEVSEPVIQAVLVGTAGGQGVSFLTEGRPISGTASEADPSPPARGPERGAAP